MTMDQMNIIDSGWNEAQWPLNVGVEVPISVELVPFLLLHLIEGQADVQLFIMGGLGEISIVQTQSDAEVCMAHQEEGIIELELNLIGLVPTHQASCHLERGQHLLCELCVHWANHLK